MSVLSSENENSKTFFDPSTRILIRSADSMTRKQPLSLPAIPGTKKVNHTPICLTPYHHIKFFP